MLSFQYSQYSAVFPMYYVTTGCRTFSPHHERRHKGYLTFCVKRVIHIGDRSHIAALDLKMQIFYKIRHKVKGFIMKPQQWRLLLLMDCVLLRTSATHDIEVVVEVATPAQSPKTK